MVRLRRFDAYSLFWGEHVFRFPVKITNSLTKNFGETERTYKMSSSKLLIMDCCRYLEFLTEYLYGALQNGSRIFHGFFNLFLQYLRFSLKSIETH